MRPHLHLPSLVSLIFCINRLVSRANLSTRPQLTISRGPTFTPTAEGSEYCKTDIHGINRLGFRYSPAGINPPGSALICRTIESNPTSYRVSWEDRSQYIHVSRDGLGLLGTKGFRSARANAPIREGKWYIEVRVDRGGGDEVADGRRFGSHVRLGWGRREASINAPVGLDGYSYGIRDKTGEKITLSRPRPYGQPFKSGDVIGMYISLPPRRKPSKKDPHDPAHMKRERIAIDFKGQETFEMLEYPQSKEMIALTEQSTKSTKSESVPSATTIKKSAAGKLPERGPPPAPRKAENTSRPLPTLARSRIAFFINGECQGTAFDDIYDFLPLKETDASKKRQTRRVREGVKEHRPNPFDDGTLGYYPFITLFNDAAVRLNPGPNFDHPPPPDIDAVLDGVPVDSAQQTWRPVCERYSEFMAEQWEMDKVEEEETKAELLRKSAQEDADNEKKAQKTRKRQTQTDSRKRAKKGHVERSMSVAEEMRAPSPANPSPLRQSTNAYEPPEETQTPADVNQIQQPDAMPEIKPPVIITPESEMEELNVVPQSASQVASIQEESSTMLEAEVLPQTADSEFFPKKEEEEEEAN